MINLQAVRRDESLGPVFAPLHCKKIMPAGRTLAKCEVRPVEPRNCSLIDRLATVSFQSRQSALTIRKASKLLALLILESGRKPFRGDVRAIYIAVF